MAKEPKESKAKVRKTEEPKKKELTVVPHPDEEEDISAEIVDLRSLAPLDKETILGSVAKTKRAVVLDEGPMIGGVSAEIAAMIQENLFSDLRGPVVRIAAQPIPPPHSPPLVDAMIPDVDQVIDAVMRLAEGGKTG